MAWSGIEGLLGEDDIEQASEGGEDGDAASPSVLMAHGWLTGQFGVSMMEEAPLMGGGSRSLSLLLLLLELGVMMV